jgi:hypothetical protein
MNFFKTLAMVGLVGFGMVSSGHCLSGHCLSVGMNLKNDCNRAHTILLAYFPSQSSDIVLKEFLYGKESSAEGLALMEANIELRKFNRSCNFLLLYWYNQIDDIDRSSRVPESCLFYIVKNGYILIPNGKNISLNELKERLNYKK